MKRLSLLAFICILGLAAAGQDLETLLLKADLSQEAKDFPKYWKSTGFSPADLLDYPDMEMISFGPNIRGAHFHLIIRPLIGVVWIQNWINWWKRI